jgi:hypothetical protein
MNDQKGSDDVNQSHGNEVTAPDLYAARITGSSETLAKLRQEVDLDVGCRGPHFEANPDGTGTMLVYASEERIRALQAAGYHVERGENVSELGRQRQKEVGVGDRFKGGRVVPRGLGEKTGRDKERGPKS